jgi:broad specificity phosphatase PhoE
MLKTAVKMATYYRTTWLNAPETEQEIEEAQKKAVAEGKRLLHVNFVRHGESEANLWWREHPGVCPWYFDPDLTPVGIEQAKARQKEIESLHVDVVVVSPLLRTLKTCKLVFSHLIGKVPFVVQPLCREQVTESDDIGKMKDTMEAQYPEYDWALVPEKQFWWYIPDDRKVEGENDLAGFNKRYKECGGWVEPVPVLANRVREFEAWLVSRPEASIAVVSHGDFIECMTGQNLRNAAHLMFEVDPLKPLEPKLDL